MEDKHEYKGLMNSDKTWKRAIGVWLYCAFGAIIIYLTIMLPLIALGVLFA